MARPKGEPTTSLRITRRHLDRLHDLQHARGHKTLTETLEELLKAGVTP